MGCFFISTRTTPDNKALTPRAKLRSLMVYFIWNYLIPKLKRAVASQSLGPLKALLAAMDLLSFASKFRCSNQLFVRSKRQLLLTEPRFNEQ